MPRHYAAPLKDVLSKAGSITAGKK